VLILGHCAAPANHGGGIRGKAAPSRTSRRHRSTRRRQDAPDLPKRKISPRTIGRTYATPDGKTFRPSLIVTLTCPSYGRVGQDGTPADPAAYDYDRAARDALAFAALFDRFIQNLRRYLGYAGRRVLVSRKWSGKTLDDHRADRRDWLLRTLDISATDPARYRWELVAPGDPDHMDRARRLLHAVADRAHGKPHSARHVDGPQADISRMFRRAQHEDGGRRQ
jgi:hypothetical protein